MPADGPVDFTGAAAAVILGDIIQFSGDGTVQPQANFTAFSKSSPSLTCQKDRQMVSKYFQEVPLDEAAAGFYDFSFPAGLHGIQPGGFFSAGTDAAACDIPDVSAVNLAGDRILPWTACKKAACRFAARG